MSKKITFIENLSDDMHCVNAVFRMVHQYYFNKDISWEDLDILTKAIPGKATWTFIGEMEFSKLGLKVTNIEPVDYNELYKTGLKYLDENFSKETADYYREKSNLMSVIKYIPEYLEIVKHESRRATVEEIKKLVQEGALVGVELNSRILNKRDGFSLHYILIYDFDESGFILHDPGLPPIEARHVTYAEFNEAFNFPGANGGVTIFQR